MRCDKVAELIGAYLDQELDAETLFREVAAHLSSCAVCATLADDGRGVGRQIAAFGREPAPSTCCGQC